MKKKVSDWIIGVGSAIAVTGTFNAASGLTHGFSDERNIQNTRLAEAAVEKQANGETPTTAEIKGLEDWERYRTQGAAGAGVAIVGLGAVILGLGRRPD